MHNPKLPNIQMVLLPTVPLINESKQLSIDCLGVQKRSTLNLLEKSSDTPPQGGGYQQLQNKRHLCCVYQRKTVH